MFDAEGSFEEETCPGCGGRDTVTYRYSEGFTELECRSCGFRSDQEELSALQRYGGELLEGDAEVLPPVPFKKLEA